MMSASQRRKGHDFERWVANRFKAALPGAEQHIKRGLQGRDGSDAPDVLCPCFWIECKRGKQPNIRAALQQVLEDCGPGVWPVAVIKDDARQPFVALHLDDFLELVKEWWERGCKP